MTSTLCTQYIDLTTIRCEGEGAVRPKENLWKVCNDGNKIMM